MFRIGEFSRIARVSARLLRYYDERGLFHPEVVESSTGYRYYGVSQLPQLNRILALREVGLSLEQITEVVRTQPSVEQLREILAVCRLETQERVAADSQRLRRIDGWLESLESDLETTDYDVVFRSEPAFEFLSVRQLLDSFEQVRHWVRLMLQMAQKIPRGKLGRFVIVIHSPEFEPNMIDAEFGYMLTSSVGIGEVPVGDGAIARVQQVPAVPLMAACVRAAPPEIAHKATAHIGRRIAAEGYRLAGANREVFLRGPNPANMASTVIELQFPVELADSVETS